MTAAAAAKGASSVGSSHRIFSGRFDGDRFIRQLRVSTLFGAIIVSSTLLFDCAPATGATTNGLRSRAAAIASVIENDNAKLAAVGEQYLQEATKESSARSQANRARVEIAQIQSAITRDRQAVTRAAIDAYVNDGNESSIGLWLANTPEEITTGRTYLGVAEGTLHNEASVLVDEEHHLNRESQVALNAETSAQIAQGETASFRNTVLGDVGAEQHLLSSVNGQLAALVAEQAAAQAAAAAARAAAAADAAAAQTQQAGPPALSTITTAPTTSPSDPLSSGSLAAAFQGIRNCESGGDYARNSGNGYYGAYQFSLSTWEGLGGTGLPSGAPPAAQDNAAYQLYQRSGFSSWPECAAILGLG